MKIFVSWSDPQSKIIAESLDKWLPKVFQSVETFFSPNIEKGTRGGDEINVALEGTSFGIICLTPGSLKSNWIHYEAGALAKTTSDPKTRIWTLLQGLRHSDVEQPLAQFQHTLAEKEDIFRLVGSINKSLEKPLLSENLRETFETWWPKLDTKLKEASALESSGQNTVSGLGKRSDREVMDEILEILRSQGRESELSRKRRMSRIDSVRIPIPRSDGDDRSIDEIRERVGSAVRKNLPTSGTTFQIEEADGTIWIDINVNPALPESHLHEFVSRLERGLISIAEE